MSFFFKALAAIVAADAIDRCARSRSTRYWYPKRPGLPPPGSTIPYVRFDASTSAPVRQQPPAAWDPEHPERP
jgi:hypothetical protein